jgi:hypothetical protein
MKKALNNVNNYLLLVLIAGLSFLQASCKKDSNSTGSTGTPVITAIRNYVAHPGDSILHNVGTGQWVVISGRNLKGALQINFDGVKGSFNDAWFSDTSAIALIPAVIAFPSVPQKTLNTIQYITTHGQTTFSFSIVPPAPSIASISDEDANPGDSVKINGFNFFFIKNVTFGGQAITSYTSANDGTSITLAVPAGIPNTGGPVSVTTNSGAATTVYNVEDFVDGVFNNWDNINGYPWGSNTDNSSINFPGNNGYYNILTATNLSAWDYAWYNGGRGVNMGGSQWVPVSDINNSPANYAVKFELNVPKSIPWTNGSIWVAVNYGFDGNNASNYMALLRPWKSASGATTPYYTNGWTTITVPLSNFRNSAGTGIQVGSITDLVGASGNTGMNINFMNDTPDPVASFTAAIDNIRVVKIK